jgi:aminopeptidase-like protein
MSARRKPMGAHEGYFSTIEALEQKACSGLPAMMPLMERLFPLCRSLTGQGVRQTLDIIGDMIPLERTQVPTGTQCFDWQVPREWNIRDAYVKNSKGERIIDFKANNLHVVSYSVPVRAKMDLAGLQEHLHSLSDYPDAVPYRASYYHEAWGFCLAESERRNLKDDTYEVLIDSTLAPGVLDYAQSRRPGASASEVFFSTYVCHPSLANDQLSGIAVLSTLMKLLGDLPHLRFSYRALFAPETMGAIAFLSQHHEELKERMKAGYVVACVGDDGPFTYVRSKRTGTAADKAAEHVVRHVAHKKGKPATIREFDPVGSDERQYCSPGLNLPVGSLLRSRHGEFKEYHTSKDDLSFVSEAGLASSLEAYLRIVQTLEMNCRPLRTNPYCEPQLGRRGLYSKLVSSNIADFQVKILNILSFADGDHDLIDIADRLGAPVWELAEPLHKLVEADLIRLDVPAAPPRISSRPKRILFVAHDRGGVNLLVPLQSHMRQHEPDIEAAFISTPMIEREVASMEGGASGLKHPVPTVKMTGSGEAFMGRSAWTFSEADLDRVLESGPWDLVVTGTSLLSSMERSIWRLCRERAVPCAAICDMWADYRRRFADGAELVVPDLVLVIDERMERELKAELGDGVRTKVVGSPHFARLIRSRRNKGAERRNIRFISEPVAELFPGAGAHEFQIAEMLIEAMERSGEAAPLVLRPHPQDDSEGWRRFAHKHRARNVRLDEEPSWACHLSTKMAIGLSSMMLIELAMAGVPVASFQPVGSDKAYYCLQEEEFGIRVVENGAELAQWLKAPTMPAVSPSFIARHEGAIEHIAGLILSGGLLS